MIARSRIALIVALTWVLAAGALQACKVPVFRFALERWPADNYRIVAITDGEPTGETATAIAKLRALADSPANVEVEVVDLQKLSDAELWQVEGLESSEDAPLLQVFFPERDGQRKLCWSGELTAANVNAWHQSPLRTDITNDIQAGISAVWVIVEGPSEEANKQLMVDLDAALAQATDQVSIPDGVIRREDASRYLALHKGASMDDVLRSDLPLRIEFSIRRLAFNGGDELAMAAMISAFADVKDAPFVFPVFGRGRMIEPLPVQQFESSAVVGACKYMVGECSCVVKALSPGVDLILNTDWQAKLGEEIVMVDAGTDISPESVEIPPGNQVPADTDGAIIQDPPPVGRLKPLLFVGMILLVAIAAFVLLRKRSRPS